MDEGQLLLIACGKKGIVTSSLVESAQLFSEASSSAGSSVSMFDTFKMAVAEASRSADSPIAAVDEHSLIAEALGTTFSLKVSATYNRG